MTVEEMAERIFQTIKGYGPACSFKEMQDRCGDEANGDLDLVLSDERPNTILWTGVSQMFADAFFSLRGKIEIHPSCELIYMMDGAFLRLPVAKRPSRTKDYKTPHWAPVVFRVRKVEECPAVESGREMSASA
jgi:hypothetical protein